MGLTKEGIWKEMKKTEPVLMDHTKEAEIFLDLVGRFGMIACNTARTWWGGQKNELMPVDTVISRAAELTHQASAEMQYRGWAYEQKDTTKK